MNYNGLDKEESKKLLKEFFRNNPSFNSSKNVRKLFKERVKNPLLIYQYSNEMKDKDGLDYNESVRISSKFRGVLMNRHWVVYIGDRTKYYWNISSDKGPLYGYDLKNSFKKGFIRFDATHMVDITEDVFKFPNRFISWDKNLFENK